MKSLTSILICACFCFFNASAQNVNVETATIKSQNLDKQFMHTFNRDLLQISNVINNTIYIFNRDGSKYTITGFDAGTLKQTVQFTIPGIKKLREDIFIEFTNDLVSVWYFKKREPATIYVNAYNYSGKPVMENKAFCTFKDLDNKGRPYLYTQTSENGKYLMLNNVIGDGGGDYCILMNSSLEKIWEKHLKFESTHEDIRRNGTILTNDGNILINGFMPDNEWVLLKGSSTSGTYTQTGSFGIAPKPQNRMTSIKGDNIYFAGFYEDNGIEQAGVYVAKINSAKCSAEYLHYDKITKDQIAGYSEVSKQSKINTPGGALPSLSSGGMFVDESENVYLSFSNYTRFIHQSYGANGQPGRAWYMIENTTILDIIINNTGQIESFAGMPLRQLNRSDENNPSYFRSVVLGKNGKAFNIYNDDEKNISKDEEERESIVSCNKASLLAESHLEGDKFVKSILLPEDKDVLIIPSCYNVFNSSTMFCIGTRDKGDLVLLKISIN